ncbi:MAG: hypothetical protein JWP91_3596 [Fibrobacteres bacterium]|nr:hypothetical protein [Fibrobacterota bacterium]
MKPIESRSPGSALSTAVALAAGVFATALVATAASAASSASATEGPARQAYYGDLHLHTSYSFDAYVMMGTKTTPEQAYRFAKGDTVHVLGEAVRRKEPLDFLAVTDHSENIGAFRDLDDPESPISKSAFGKSVRAEGPGVFWRRLKDLLSGKAVDGFDLKPGSRTAWERYVKAANDNYQPGKFTTFIGYEWTSMPDGQNLHRNVIFRGDHAPYPYTSGDSWKPEDLWAFLDAQRKQGVEALAIPHNANASNGLMYDWNNSNGKPIDEAYALRRAENEPLTEISQNKGASETHPALSPNDEFANFEIFDHLLISPKKSAPGGSYVRDALGRGLELEKRTGANPFKYGVVGGSDFHGGLSQSDEAAYEGNIGGNDSASRKSIKVALAGVSGDAPGKAGKDDGDGEHGPFKVRETGSGNLAAVWAERNTRESIYDALRRKETFATSGSRLKLRLFGGWDFGKDLLKEKDWVSAAYGSGVPMGGDLPARAGKSRPPRFVVWAAKDPNGANLDRVQIIKVWLKGGRHQERIFNVAWSGDRKADAKGQVKPVGNTVDTHTGKYGNTIGGTELAAVWEDPEFDAAAPAVYYLRVLEIPTPRWSTLLAARNGQPLPKDAPATLQERGWSSPIWYTPAKTPVEPGPKG